MKIISRLDGSFILADRIMEYVDSIQREYDFSKKMGGSVEEMFMDSACNTFAKARINLNTEEFEVFDQILKSRIPEYAQKSS